MIWEFYTLPVIGLKGDHTVYNISTDWGTGMSAAGRVVVNRGEDVRLPSGGSNFR